MPTAMKRHCLQVKYWRRSSTCAVQSCFQAITGMRGSVHRRSVSIPGSILKSCTSCSAVKSMRAFAWPTPTVLPVRKSRSSARQKNFPKHSFPHCRKCAVCLPPMPKPPTTAIRQHKTSMKLSSVTRASGQ